MGVTPAIPQVGPGDCSESHSSNKATSGIWRFLYCGNLTYQSSCFLESSCLRNMALHLAVLAIYKAP